MNNRIDRLFTKKQQNILSIYFTAGYPALDDTISIALLLEKHGADLIEIGMPYSDPLADGLTIQQSSQQALKNGMHLDLLFSQIRKIRLKSDIPIILMGYLNQWMQYGKEAFCAACQDTGVDGLIIPDLPMKIYEAEYASLLEAHQLGISFLISPQTSTERINQAVRLSTAFVYMVSQSAITGMQDEMSEVQLTYFNRIKEMALNRPCLIGFGIHSAQTLQAAWRYGQGAIIGSAFIRALKSGDELSSSIRQFFIQLKQNP